LPELYSWRPKDLSLILPKRRLKSYIGTSFKAFKAISRFPKSLLGILGIWKRKI